MTGLDRAEYIHKRKRKYMAQVLERFEETIEPHVPEGVAQDFKGLVRARINALAVDSVDILTLGEAGHQNGIAQDFKDTLHPTGRP